MKKKKWLWILLCVVLLAGLAVFFFRPVTKIGITSYVKRNVESLEDYVAEVTKTEYGTFGYGEYNEWIVSLDTKTGMVQFDTVGFGIVPSSSHWGFYYSPEDKPLGFDGTDVEFKESGKGWLWQEENGDNRNYTEKITDNWYWFKMEF